MKAAQIWGIVWTVMALTLLGAAFYLEGWLGFFAVVAGFFFNGTIHAIWASSKKRRLRQWTGS